MLQKRVETCTGVEAPMKKAFADHLVALERGAIRGLTWIADLLILAGGFGLGFGIARVSPAAAGAGAALMGAAVMLWRRIPRDRKFEIVQVAGLVGQAVARLPRWIGASWKNRPPGPAKRDWGKVAVWLLVLAGAALAVYAGRPLVLAADACVLGATGGLWRRSLRARLAWLTKNGKESV